MMATRLPPGKEEPTHCKKCQMTFNTWAAYHLHKQVSDKHLSCFVCSADFKNEEGQKRHWRQAHAAEQDLSCPGCQKKFTRVGGLMSHIELAECPAMKAQYLARRNEQDSMTGQFDLIREAMSWGAANDGITFGTSVDNVANLKPAVLLTPIAASFAIQEARQPAVLTPSGSFPSLNTGYQLDNANEDLISFELNAPWGEASVPVAKPIAKAVNLKSVVEFPTLGVGTLGASISKFHNIMDQPVPQRKVAATLASNSTNLPLPTAVTSGTSNRTPPDWGQITENKTSVSTTNTPSYLRATSQSAAPTPSNTFASPSLQRDTLIKSSSGVTAQAAASAPSVWGGRGATKVLFPDTPPAVAPPADLLKNLSLAGSNIDQGSKKFAEHDPNDPDLKIGKYYVSFTRKYKCPHKGCTKSLPTPSSFLQHLKSPAHIQDNQRLKCPNCLRFFASATALTMHAESQAVRCNINQLDEYDHYVDDITASTAKVIGRHEDDNTVKYGVVSHDRDGMVQNAAQRVVESNAAALRATDHAKAEFWRQHKPKW